MIFLKNDMPLKIQLKNDIKELSDYKNMYMQKIYEYRQDADYMNLSQKNQQYRQMGYTLSNNSEQIIKTYNTQIFNIERNIDLLNNILENINRLNEYELIKLINKYNYKYNVTKKNITRNFFDFEANKENNFQNNIHENYNMNKETKKEVESNDIKNDFANFFDFDANKENCFQKNIQENYNVKEETKEEIKEEIESNNIKNDLANEDVQENIFEIGRNIKLISNLLENASKLNADELVKMINKYNNKDNATNGNITINFFNFEANKENNLQKNIQENCNVKEEIKEEVVSDDIKNDLVNEDIPGDINNNSKLIENSDDNAEIQNNDTLLISEINKENNIQENIQENCNVKEEIKEEVVSDDIKNDLVNEDISGDINNNSNQIENSDDNDEIQNNDTLLISEILKAVVLPYTGKEVLEILENEKEKYKTAEDVIKDKFTRPLSDYKFQSLSRYRETMKLLTVRQKCKLGESISLALEIMKKKFLHPSIISACRNLDELDVYLDCLEKNELDDFKIFKIKYELHPALVKNKGRDKKSKLIKAYPMKQESTEV